MRGAGDLATLAGRILIAALFLLAAQQKGTNPVPVETLLALQGC